MRTQNVLFRWPRALSRYPYSTEWYFKVKLGDGSIAVSSEDRLRRVSPVAVHPGEGPLTERIARVQPVQRGLVFMLLRLDPSIDRREAGKQSFDRGVGFP